MDDIEIIEWIYDDDRVAEKWRDRLRSHETVQLRGRSFELVDVFHISNPFGHKDGSVWTVKARPLD